MKMSKSCPKCGSVDILRIEGTAGASAYTDNCFMAGMTIFSAVKVHRYLCCSCGYSEEWVDREDLSKVKTYYEKQKAAGEKRKGNY